MTHRTTLSRGPAAGVDAELEAGDVDVELEVVQVQSRLTAEEPGH